MKSKIILFLVDGMRPDGMLQAEMPMIKQMMKKGVFTLNARTVFPSVTLPCHTSLFLSVTPERHGILTNTWTPQVRPIPSLFDVLFHANKVACSFYNWENLRDLSKPGSLSAAIMISNLHAPIDKADMGLTDISLQWLLWNNFDFAFIYLGKTDEVGHEYGWMSQQYLLALHHADLCIAKVINALPKDTNYFVIADHGGHDQTHGTNLDEDMTIPIVMQGPDISKDIDTINHAGIIDVAPTIIKLFNITKPKEWVGKALF